MSYVICFWDKSKIQVSDADAAKIKAVIQSEKYSTITLGNNLYAVKGIEKIITKDEAYEVFPEEWNRLGNMQDLPPSSSTDSNILDSGNKLLN